MKVLCRFCRFMQQGSSKFNHLLLCKKKNYAIRIKFLLCRKKFSDNNKTSVKCTKVNGQSYTDND